MRALALVPVVIVAVSCGARQVEETTLRPGAETVSPVFVAGDRHMTEVEATGGALGVIANRVPFPPDQAWRAMVPAFAELGLRGAGVVDADRRVYGFPDAVMPRRIGGERLSTFLDCGQSPGGANADTWRVTGTILAAVRPSAEPEHAVIEVSVQAQARPRDVSGATSRCASTGRLERLIARTVLVHAWSAR